VFVGSPKADVTSNLDEWIDKYCLHIDVFRFITKTESTLITEKNFFHEVSVNVSKSNIFILNDRKYRKIPRTEKHMFFISELKALQAHIQEQLEISILEILCRCTIMSKTTLFLSIRIIY